MMKLKNITVQLGGFHDHWLRNGTEVSTLLMAAMQYFHYDFICLMDSDFGEKALKEKSDIERWMPGKKVFLGVELMYDWGHVVTVQNSCKDFDLANPDWRTELQKIHKGGGFVALAHIGYPYGDTEPTFKDKEIDEIIENDYTDAVQLERVTDWQWVEKRANRGDKLPLVGGWDAHRLYDIYDNEANLYTKNCTPENQIDSAPGMRTIVFAEDNSLESIKKAIREGKSVLEHVETSKLYGSPELINTLIENGYFEKIKELSDKQNELILKNDILTAYTGAKLQFPGKGTVTVPYDNDMSCKELETDENGILTLDSAPLPAMLDFSHLPFRWKGDKGERMWAVKVENNIQYIVIPKIMNGKRYLTVKLLKDLECDITVHEPIQYEGRVSAKKDDELICLEIPDEVPDIFNISFELNAVNGGYSEYSKKTGIAIAKSNNKDWSECPLYYANTQEQCGGFGSNRPYPGEDVFSGKAQFKWDEKFLYVKFDIVDEIHIAPPSGHWMYRSDCICISFDPKLMRNKSFKDLSGFMIGFPEEGPEIVGITNLEEEAGLFHEETPKGRIVTAYLPWDKIGAKPEKGLHIGIHFSFLNDNGTGLLDNVHWPMPAENGRMEQAWDFGILYLN